MIIRDSRISTCTKLLFDPDSWVKFKLNLSSIPHYLHTSLLSADRDISKFDTLLRPAVCSLTINSSFRFLPSRLLQLTVAWCVWRPRAEASVDPERPHKAHHRRLTMRSRHSHILHQLKRQRTGFLSDDESTTKSYPYQSLSDDIDHAAYSGRRLLRSAVISSHKTYVIPRTPTIFGDRSFAAASPRM